jgi:RNA polymerase sigma factor (sigma-70 family)
MSEATLPLPLSRARSSALRLLGDDRLARFAARGDADAFAVIYERHLQALYRYCLAIVANPDDASDCLQTVMMKAFDALRQSSREISLKPWLFRIAHNEAISLIRRRRPAAEETEETVGSAPGADVDADRRESLTRLVADLRELPERQRGALIMRELNGMDVKEIAEWLGTSTGGARQAIFQARTALQEYAAGREMDHEEVREAISEGDSRRLGSRRIQAHLRECAACREIAGGGRAVDGGTGAGGQEAHAS